MLKVREAKNQSEFENGHSGLKESEKSFLQSWEYGQMQKKLGYEPLYLVFENPDGAIIYSLLLILFRARRGTYLFCPYGLHDAEQLKVLIEFLKKYSVEHKVDFLRFSPLMEDTAEHKKLFSELGFRSAPVHMMHPELLWLLDISKDEKTLLQGMRKNTRYAIKQAEKLVENGELKIVQGSTEKLLKDFYEIHEETSKRQKFVPYAWTYLKAQLDEFGEKDAMKIYIAEHNGKNIAAAVIMLYGNEGVYHHGASLSEYNKIPASYLIQWQAIKEAKSRSMKYYNFWGVVDNAPKHPWAGLSFFKKGFGGEGKSILHCQDLPLTAKYWLNFVVETFRRIKRGY